MKPVRSILLRILGALLIAYLAFVGLIWWAMHQPPETFGRVMRSEEHTSELQSP